MKFIALTAVAALASANNYHGSHYSHPASYGGHRLGKAMYTSSHATG